MRLTALLLLAAICQVADDWGPSIARFKTYAIDQVGTSRKEAERMVARLTAKDVAGARRAWRDVSLAWERSRVLVAAVFPDLEKAIDGSGGDGLRGIEAGLFAATQEASLTPSSEALRDHLTALEQKLRDTQLPPQVLYDAMVRVLSDINTAKPPGGDAGRTRDDLRARMQGVAKVWGTVFEGPMERVKREADAQIDKGLTALKRMLDVQDAGKLDVEHIAKDAGEIAHALSDAALGFEIPKAGS
jgi:iron uptake system EfeUOB component EfeO/EfeM